MNAWGAYINLLDKMKWFSRPGSIFWSLLPAPAAIWFIYDLVSLMMMMITSTKIFLAMAIASMVMIGALLLTIPQAFYALRDQHDPTLTLKGRYPITIRYNKNIIATLHIHIFS